MRNNKGDAHPLEKCLFVLFIIALFASLGTRGGGIRETKEALFLLTLFTVQLWCEKKPHLLFLRNGFLISFFLFAIYGLLQVFAHQGLSFILREHALRFPCYFIAALFAFHFARKETSLHLLLFSVSAVGVVFAILISASVLEKLRFWTSQEVMDLGFSRQLWFSRWSDIPFVASWVSPYFNANILSYFFELTAFLPLGLLFHRILSLKERRKRWSIGLDPEVLFWAAGFFTIAGALFVLLSRGALVAFFIGLFLFLCFLATKRAKWILIVFLFMMGALYWLEIRPVTRELQTIQEDVTMVGGLTLKGTFTPRVEAWETLTRIFISHFWLGSGPGTYPVLYFAYKPSWALPMSSPRGYNDALELLAELGIIGGVLFLGIVASYLFYFFKSVLSPDKRSLHFFASSAITCGITAVFFHSLVESGLQYFSISCFVALLGGACMGACHNLGTEAYGRAEEEIPGSLSDKLRKGISPFLVTVGVILLGIVIVHWWTIPWSRLSTDPFEDAKKKVSLDPAHPDHRAQLGAFFLKQAMNPKTLDQEKRRYLDLAHQEYEMIKKLNPYSFEYYNKMAWFYIAQKDFAKAVQMLREWETTFPNAVDAKIETTLYYLEMAVQDKPENPVESPYFSEAKAAVERARMHRPTFGELRWYYWKKIYGRFRYSHPVLLKAVAKSGLLKDQT